MDIKSLIKQKLNETLEKFNAKKLGLTHVGHGIYKSRDGKKFTWGWNTFVPVKSTPSREKSESNWKKDIDQIYDEVSKRYNGKFGSSDETNKKLKDEIELEVLFRLLKKNPDLKQKLSSKLKD